MGQFPIGAKWVNSKPALTGVRGGQCFRMGESQALKPRIIHITPTGGVVFVAGGESHEYESGLEGLGCPITNRL